MSSSICGVTASHLVNALFSEFLRYLVWLWTASLYLSFSVEVRSLFPSLSAPLKTVPGITTARFCTVQAECSYPVNVTKCCRSTVYITLHWVVGLFSGTVFSCWLTGFVM